MNLIGEKVKHISFGDGIIKECSGNYITIAINSEDKQFSYPLAFDKYLTCINSDCQKYIKKLVKEKKAEAERIAKEERQKKEEELLERIRQADSKKKSSKSAKKATASNNIAFKCTYCDGDSNETHIGFNGLCSDKMIDYNVKEKKQKWCSDSECKCMQFTNNEISKKELEDHMINGGVCYESVMLQNWEARGGIYRSGKKKGEPIPIKRAKKNALVILTTRTPHEPEINRIIFAVYIADEVTQGNDGNEAIITAHDKYRIELTSDESKQLPYWKYYSNKNSSNKPLWGTSLFRYIENNSAYHLLNDILEIKSSEEEKELVKEMLDFYCEKNNVNADKIIDLNGLIK